MIRKSYYFKTPRHFIIRVYGQLKLPFPKILMDSEQNKLLIFNGNPESFPEWCERFLAYIEDKNLNVESEKVSEANRDAIQRKLDQKIIMHLNDATLQMIITQNNRNRFEIWKYFRKHLGRFEQAKSLCFGKSF